MFLGPPNFESCLNTILRARPPGNTIFIKACDELWSCLESERTLGDPDSERSSNSASKWQLTERGAALYCRLRDRGAIAKVLELLSACKAPACCAVFRLLGNMWELQSGPASVCTHAIEHVAPLACMQRLADDSNAAVAALYSFTALAERHDCASALVRQDACSIVVSVMEKHPANASLNKTACAVLAFMARCRQRPFCAWHVLFNCLRRFKDAADDGIIRWAVTAAAEAARHRALMVASGPHRDCTGLVATARKAWQRGVAGAAAEEGAGMFGLFGLSLASGLPRSYNFNIILEACNAIASLCALRENAYELANAGAAGVLLRVYQGIANFGYETVVPHPQMGPAKAASAAVHGLAMMCLAGVHGELPVPLFGGPAITGEGRRHLISLAERAAHKPLAFTDATGTLIKALWDARSDTEIVERICLALREITATELACRCRGAIGVERSSGSGGVVTSDVDPTAPLSSTSSVDGSESTAGSHWHEAAFALEEDVATRAMHALAVTLQNYIGNARVAAAACGALRNLCAAHDDDPDGVGRWHAAPFLETLHVAASLHARSDESVAFAACGALFATACRGKAMTLKILGETLHAGGAAAMAMQCHPTSARVVWAACGFLCTLVPLTVGAFAFREEVLAALLDDSCVEAPLIRALHDHGSDPRVVRAACTALESLVKADIAHAWLHHDDIASAAAAALKFLQSADAGESVDGAASGSKSHTQRAEHCRLAIGSCKTLLSALSPSGR